jgi:uncharacterized protein with GYD domain
MIFTGRFSEGQWVTSPTEDIAMPFYLIQVIYKDTAAKSLVMRPQAREDVISKTCSSLGGKLHSFFFLFGEYDVVALAELPDNAAAAAFALGTASGGAVSKFHTTVLLTAAEGLEAMRKAQQIDYGPPVMS